MHQNSDKCYHCGRMFVRIEGTAIVNRSDGKTFHVSLVSGPEHRHSVSSGFHENQAMCKFGYVHDLIGPKRKSLDVFIRRANEGRQELLQQIERAADQIVRLVHAGRELEPTYTFDGGLLAPGYPK